MLILQPQALSSGSTPTFKGLTLTSTLTLTSAATNGLQLYNTADQTTNYERLEALWSSNVARIRTAQGGSGVARNLGLGTPIATITVKGAVETGGIVTYGAATSGLVNYVGHLFSGGSTATSGTNIGGISITPTYNQASGTAANTDLLINRTETAVGSGAQYLAQMQVGGSDRFRVDNQGSAQTAGNFGFISKTLINSPSNGVLTIWNNAQNDFSRLQLGGTTSAFSAIERLGSCVGIIDAADSVALTPPTITGAGLMIANVTAAPSTNPVGGGILYCESGALKYRGTGGTITTIANA